MLNTFRNFLRDLWRLTKPYWTSNERWIARSLLAAVILLNLGTVFVAVEINKWQASFFNSLEKKDQVEFMRLLGVFGGLALAYIVMAVYQLYLSQMLQIKWRRWLTERYLDDWLGHRTYYRLQLTDRATDNPDQRIADDLNSFVGTTLSLTLGLLNAVVTLGSFLYILWGLSGAITLPIGEGGVTVPGYLVWVALIYAAAGTWLAHLIGRPLVGLNFTRQRVEADFRFSLVRFRENTEAIALYAGEEDEKRGFMRRFVAVAENWWDIMRRQKKLTWFQAFYGQLAVIFPYVVVAPRYFSGAIALGGLMQTASAFGQVQGSLSWFIDAYATLAEWKATVDRLVGFRSAMDVAGRAAVEAPGVERVMQPRGDIAAESLKLSLPNGRVLLEDAQLVLQPGVSTLVTGPSGCGKSTLFRAFAGIWPFGEGRVFWPEQARILFLPQRPYLPIGTLRQVLSYPSSAEAFDDATLNDALNRTGLGRLQERLDEQQHWGMLLSGGEQQRIGFARAWLHRPAWLFLDEASSALDDSAERAMYELLEELTQTTVVSIGHRAGLVALHRRRIVIEGGAAGAGSLKEEVGA